MQQRRPTPPPEVKNLKQLRQNAWVFVRALQSRLIDDYEQRSVNIEPQRIPQSMRKRPDWHKLEVIRLWTIDQKDASTDREWCAMLQMATISDEIHVVLAAARLWRVMNLLLVRDRVGAVSKRTAGPVVRPEDRVERQFAPSTRGCSQGQTVQVLQQRMLVLEKGVLYRGARMPRSKVNELIAIVENVRKGQDDGMRRSPRAIPTSPNKGTANSFMVTHGYADGYSDAELVGVRFKFLLDPELEIPCQHVTTLDFLSAVPGEGEFLFPPYSAFQLKNYTEFDLKSETVDEDKHLPSWAKEGFWCKGKGKGNSQVPKGKGKGSTELTELAAMLEPVDVPGRQLQQHIERYGIKHVEFEFYVMPDNQPGDRGPPENAPLMPWL